MKRFQLLFCALFLFALTFTLNSAAFAQNKSLPAELSEKSSLAEILAWLDKTSFPYARIGMNINVMEPNEDSIRTDVDRYSEWAFFAQGFKLVKSNGCKITLRNDDVKLISFATKYPNPAKGSFANFRKTANNQAKHSSDLLISLDKLSDKKGKAPFQHTKKTDEANLLGTWRTEFKLKNKFFLLPPSKEKMQSLMNELKIEINGSRQDGQNESMIGDTLTFTFDDKEMSEKFNAAFRLAIKQCSKD
jgi:hypothetical protein